MSHTPAATAAPPGSPSTPRPSGGRVALLTHVAPEPPWSGERRRAAATFDFLSSRYDCDVIVCARSDERRGRLRRQLAHPLAPPYAARFAPPAGLDLDRYDLIWVFELWAFASVPRASRGRVVWDKDTVMADSYASSESFRSRLLHHWVAWYERRGMGSVRHAFVSLPSARAPLGVRVSLLPPGFVVDGEPSADPTPAPHDGLRLGFVGLLGFEPNRQALMEFARGPLQRLRAAAELPGPVELWVAGGGLPTEDATVLEGVAGVVTRGYVPDLASFYTDVDLAVAPMLGGAGTPTKVVEALGHGVPVVGTREGLRGLDPPLRRWCEEVADGDWVAAVRRAADIRASEESPAESLRHGYSWPAVFERHVATVLDGLGD